ncbi:cytokine SCM-1 beta-like [Sorex araneus]|uniref:cytokine SCM-1 beta-like n=1 Tax=Sorex araneus TaxID=42254 RepID=UPI0003314882|nr:cytokine SCM-1 beta-like [Sorex araneus]
MRLVFLALLLSACLLKSAVEGVGSEVISRRMCVRFSNRPVPGARIRTYTIEEGPMRAVVFVSKRGFEFCADPDETWVKKAMKTVDSRNRIMVQTGSAGTQQPTETAGTLAA